MFKRGIYHHFTSAHALMVFALLQQCHLTKACVPSASCSCFTGFNNRIQVTCQVESLTNLSWSIRKPEEVHQLVITGIIRLDLPENVFINFSNLAILSLRGNNLRFISNQSFNGLLQLSELDIAGNKLQEWKGDITHQIPSLTTLDVTGNTNWTITENILSHKSLRVIKGASIGASCTVCRLVRNYDESEISEGNEGAIIHKGCLKHKYIFSEKNQELTKHHFFPKCIVQETSCLKAIGRVEKQNICLEIGRSILISALPIGIFALFLNLIVLTVIVFNKNLRSNSSLLLVSSMCASGVMSSVYSVAIATVYQIVPVNEIESKRVSICPSLGFIATLSLSSMVLISLAVTIERYLAVVFCMKLHIRLRIKQAYYVLLVTWLIALLMAGWSVVDTNIYGTKGYETYICLSIQSVLEKKYLGYTITSVITSAIGYLPTIPLYIHIFLVVRKSGSQFGIKREATLARRIFLLVGSNLLFLAVPMCLSHVAIATGEMGGFSEKSKFIVVTSTKVICMSTNALLNPILYGCRNEKFGKALQKSWKWFGKQRGRNKPMDREDTSHKSEKCQKSQTCLTQL